MKKNRKTYTLLVLVLSIWGILGFRILRTVGPGTDPIGPIHDSAIFKIPIGKEKDTFSLLADYRDPFLGTLPLDLSAKRPVTKLLPKKVPVPVDIRYTGFVKENRSGSNIFFVHIDGEQRMLSRNESYKEVKLLSGNGDRITVRANGRNMTIALTK